MAKGGTRVGGKPKGYKAPKTIAKEAARDALRQIVLQHMEAMTRAQIQQASGLSYLVTRDKKTGKFLRVGPAMASAANEETIEVWEKDPSTPAYTDLMNRAIDKPKEQPQEIAVTGTLNLVSRLHAARKRLQQR